MKKFKGFTLTELMVALAVIGILVAIVTPTIMKTRPNKNKMMIKKAYYTTENIVGSLINDPTLYADMTSACTHPEGMVPGDYCAYGFDYDAAAETGAVSYSGDTKFQGLFASKLNISNADADFTNFSTTDGMSWDFTNIKTGWVKGAAPAANIRELVIDVNGAAPPNCLEAACEDADDFDRFRVRIRSDGKMAINPADTKATEFITINTSTVH